MTKKQKNLLIRVIAAGVLMAVFSFLPLDDYPIVRFLLFLIPYLTVGYDILRKAFKGIRNKQVFDEHFLMAVATELFQSYAVGKSRRSISELMDIRPDYANIETEDGKIEKVDPDDVEVGTIIVVQPGEKVPIDGIVREGKTLSGKERRRSTPPHSRARAFRRMSSRAMKSSAAASTCPA